ncbi:MAG TPA: arylsulfotransferase family protein [Planctomycetota bacterium]|nr:arylsulfotransferase family protein [Planctomycetota bacterium]
MKPKDLLPRLAFVLALVFFAYLGGFFSCHFKVFPHDFLVRAIEQGVQVSEQGAQPSHHIHLARHDFSGVHRPAGAKVADGAILVTSYWPEFDWGPGLRLLDRDGKELHSWNADPRRIWSESPHQDGLRGAFLLPTNYVHGSYLFENGDVLFSIEYLGLVRMNAAGEVIWKLDRRTHHSVTRNERGNFWVPSARWLEGPTDVANRFPGLTPPLAEDIALEVTPDGTVVREASVLAAIFANPVTRRAIWTVGTQRGADLLHVNDVEELPTAMAAAYATLKAGDLLVSVRELDLVFAMDPDTLAMKWWSVGPYHRQHDPDFLGDGTISVFGNNEDGSLDGDFLGGSRLWQIGIASGSATQIYPRGVPGERRFYTPAGGKAQRLPDGHWLLTEARAGRVFEVDGEGRTVWEWCHQRYDDRTICEVLEGTFYPLTAEDVRRWTKQ